jgi:MFS family permease
MTDHTENGRAIVSNHTMEIATAIAIMIAGALVMTSNYELGMGWDSNGPQSGYFPFYVGVILFISATATLVTEILKRDAADRDAFVESKPFLRVLQIVIPTIIYVVAIIYIGIYVATAIFVTTFMIWLGKYRWYLAVAFGVGIAVALFFTFEVWFLVPLPKGPVEALFGY